VVWFAGHGCVRQTLSSLVKLPAYMNGWRRVDAPRALGLGWIRDPAGNSGAIDFHPGRPDVVELRAHAGLTSFCKT